MEAKNRSDSVDSRSYSFDSTDSKIKIIIIGHFISKTAKNQ